VFWNEKHFEKQQATILLNTLLNFMWSNLSPQVVVSLVISIQRKRRMGHTYSPLHNEMMKALWHFSRELARRSST